MWKAASVETGREAMPKRKAKAVISDSEFDVIGKGTCQDCGGEYFKIDIWGGGDHTIKCSHCGKVWPGHESV